MIPVTIESILKRSPSPDECDQERLKMSDGEECDECLTKMIPVTIESILKRSPSPDECDQERLKMSDGEECDLECKQYMDRTTLVSPERSTKDKLYVDRGTCISPERLFNSPTKQRIRKCFEEKIRMEKKDKKRVSGKLRLAQTRIAYMQRIIDELRKKEKLPTN